MIHFQSLFASSVPRQFEIGLPIPEELVKTVLVIAFCLHLIFVNFMVGGTLLAVVFEALGFRDKKYDALAKWVAKTILFNKSIAVTLGIGPLLCMALSYTIPFYTANILTAPIWFTAFFLILFVFLLTYLYEFQWDTFVGRRKPWHFAFGVLSLLIFLVIPLVFFINTNLMLYPDEWTGQRSWEVILSVGNILPRYFHFLFASVALTGLFLAGWTKVNVPENIFWTRAKVIRLGYQICFYVSLVQFIVGPIVLMTLPKIGQKADVILHVLGGAFLALVTLFLMWLEIISEDKKIGRLYWLLVIMLFLVVLSMVTGRHRFREHAIGNFQNQTEESRKQFERELDAFENRESEPDIPSQTEKLEAIEKAGIKEPYLFQTCFACHKDDDVRLAPSLGEIAALYKNSEKMVRWMQEPEKKRPEYSAMPSFAHVNVDHLREVADYILQLYGEDKG